MRTLLLDASMLTLRFPPPAVYSVLCASYALPANDSVGVPFERYATCRKYSFT